LKAFGLALRRLLAIELRDPAIQAAIATNSVSGSSRLQSIAKNPELEKVVTRVRTRERPVNAEFGITFTPNFFVQHLCSIIYFIPETAFLSSGSPRMFLH
jgi:hypothetical protein